MPRGRPRGSTAASSGTKIKGAMTAYACFVKTCREEHKKLHPDENVQFGEFAAQCSQRWKTMKRERDPNKPKRALSAFFYYAKDERPNVRSINPDFSVGEVAKELGRKWNELSESEKAPYEKSAEEDRARYDVEMKAYRSGELPAKKIKTTNGHAIAPANDDIEDGEPDEEEEEEDEEGEE